MPPKKPKKILLTAEDVVFSKGIDTYVNPGSAVHQISMAVGKRSAFFKERPSVQALLLRDTHNPLVQEDGCQPQEGEFFLNHEAITLLIERLIRTHKAQAHGLEYNSKNIFVIKNDRINLEHILSSLNLMDGQDAKIIYMDGIHSIPCYIRNTAGLIRCFIVNPESSDFCSVLAKSIKNVFPHVTMVASTGMLQKDYYSCSTFAIKTLLYFVKHGQDVFPYIDSVNKKRKHDEQPCEELELKQLMPALLKMLQGSLNLSEESLKTIVSVKHQLTLADYYKKYAVTEHNETYNSAALLKKYSYLDKLDQYLERIDAEEISTDNKVSLPLALTKRHNLYANLPATAVIHPVTAYQEISAFLDGRSAKLIHPGTIRAFNAIKSKFPEFEEQYKNEFSKSADKNSYCLSKLLIIAGYAEIQDLNHLKHYQKYAEKLKYFFGDLATSLSYLQNHAQINNRQAIRDLCEFKLPYTECSWDHNFWIKLAVDHGHAATKYLPLAPHINQLLIQHKKTDPKISDLDHICFLLKNSPYKGAEKHRELAALCVDLLLTQPEFDICLNMVQKGFKPFDFLPEISFSCADIDKKLAKYTFKKLPINDLRGLFLGDYSSCCQSIHKSGRLCVLHGMTSAFGGFYVVCNKEEIIAQAWVWISTEGQVVFDSWECINKSQALLFKPVLIKAAQQLINAGFSRVLIGTGGNTPDMNFPKAKYPAPFLLESNFSDAKAQCVIQVSPLESKATKFKAFSKAYGLESSQYAYLINEKPGDNLVLKLTRLIATKALPFADFIKLISFEYIHSNAFLHQRTQALHQLLLTAFPIYGNKMQQLFSLKNAPGENALDVFLSFDDVNGILASIITILGDKDVGGMTRSWDWTDLLYSAVQSDAIKTLRYLHALNANKLSYDDLTSLEYANNSLLKLAAKHKALKSIEYIIETIGGQNKLKLLIDSNKKGSHLILHYFAQANAVTCFKNIENVCDKTLLRMLLNDESETEFSTVKSQNVLLTAFYAGSWEFVTYILNGPYGFNKNELINVDTLARVIISNSLKQLTFLWELHNDENYWQKTLLKIKKNVLEQALYAGSYDTVLFLLDHFKFILDLHHLLTFGEVETASSLDNINFENNPARIELIINKILARYANNKEKLVALFSPGLRRSFFLKIILSNNNDLLKQILDYFSTDSKLLDKLLFNQDNLMNSVNAVLVYSNSDIRDYHRDAISIIFSFCSIEQQKRILSAVTPEFISAEMISYLHELHKTYSNTEEQEQIMIASLVI